MHRTARIFILTLICLALLDVLVAVTLGWAGRAGKAGSLVQYFEYGRSVPGKLAKWQAEPDARGNLFDVAWRAEALARSQEAFQTGSAAPTIRSYGMSFTNNILKQAQALQPDLIWDNHGGPAAPPNLTYGLFVDDRANRRAGDVVIFGVLSSSVPAMAALSNRTWLFEQPAPLTYPIFHLEGDGLRRVEPLIDSAAAERGLSSDRQAAQAWHTQLAQEDAFFAPQTFAATWLDASPFVRLVRRSMAKSHVEAVKSEIIEGTQYPYDEVLRRMIASFAKMAREDGQIPVVMLIQSRDSRDPELLTLAQPILMRDTIPYLATVEHYDPRDMSGFLPDGHYRRDVDRMFGQAFLDLLRDQE